MKSKLITVLLMSATLLPCFCLAADFNANVLQYDPAEKGDITFGGGKSCSVALHFRVDRYPDLTAGEWSDVSPMTIFRMDGAAADDPTLFARIIEKRLTITLFKKDKSFNFTITADLPVKTGCWNHMVLTDTGTEMRLYVDGEQLGYRWHPRQLPGFVRMQMGAEGGKRRMLLGAFKDKFAFYDRCLTQKEIEKIYQAGTPAEIRAAAEQRRRDYEKIRYIQDECPYRPLEVVKDDLHPLIDQLGIRTTAVPWFDSRGRDLLIVGSGAFGSRLAVYRFIEMRDGLPVYDHGTTISSLPRSYYLPLPNTRKTFDLFSIGNDTSFGSESLVQYINNGRPGAPEFRPRPVLFDGKNMQAALNGGVVTWALADVNGDGTEDFLYVRFLSLGGQMDFPFEGNPWTGKEVRYAGSGRGFDIRGNWLGADSIAEFHWVPGKRESDGALNFGKSHQIMTDVENYPLLWKTIKSRRAVQTLKLDGRTWLLTTGNVDEIMAVAIDYRDGEVYSGEARPLLKSGYVIPQAYLPANITTVDLDGDGFKEILLDGPACVTAVMKGRKIGEFEAVGLAQTQGGALACEALTSPCRFDWNEDGLPDLLTGDGSGHVLLWAGTEDPWKYRTGSPFTVNGVPYQPVAGMTGSIQGPNEKRWGYTKVAVGRWNGRKAMVVNDITGEMVLFYPAQGVAALQPKIPFTCKGRPFKVAWRSRPAIINAECGFAGVPHDSLLVQDWDGDLAVAMPDAPGSANIDRVDKLHYSDGETIRLCGPAGLWGRGAVTLFDWDRDGNLDMIFGTNRSCQQFFYEKLSRKGTRPYLIRNEGTNARPVFARPRPFGLKNGTELKFGVHNATPWVTDLNGDGKADLLIGAEDGKVYGFLNEELIVEE